MNCSNVSTPSNVSLYITQMFLRQALPYRRCLTGAALAADGHADEASNGQAGRHADGVDDRLTKPAADMPTDVPTKSPMDMPTELPTMLTLAQQGRLGQRSLLRSNLIRCCCRRCQQSSVKPRSSISRGRVGQRTSSSSRPRTCMRCNSAFRRYRETLSTTNDIFSCYPKC